MSDQILVPSLGESITEATVSKWLKQIGEKVESDEAIVELETDKVNVEVPSPFSGTLASIKVEEGNTVKVGALLGIVEVGKINEDKSEKIEEKYTPPKSMKKKNINQKKKLKGTENLETLTLVKSKKEEVPKETLVLDTLIEESDDNSNIEENDNSSNIEENDGNSIEEKYVPPKTKQNLSPSVRKIIKEKKIDLSNIEGTEKGGRISKGDLINIMGDTPQPSERKITHGPEERVKMTRLRVTIAKRLKEAQDNAAMLTTFNEVDMQNIIQMRQDYQEDFQKKYSVKLGFMSFFVKASVVALKNFPAVNAQIEKEHITYKNYYNISIAIGTERGLVVPVLKNTDQLSFADIERNIFALSEKAQKGKITINDLQGGTFTISNGGIYGSMLSTPILNPPQTGILGMHNIVDRPVVKDNNIVIRPIMYLALSYDHRIIDGKEAVSFLKTIKECLEEPRRLFLDL
jgi:2-oxoglutarate dehydrogenase E2 component (dihydrolipoamide succinyltransferase)